MGVLRSKYVPESSKPVYLCMVFDVALLIKLSPGTQETPLSFLSFVFRSCHNHEHISRSSESYCYSSPGSGS